MGLTSRILRISVSHGVWFLCLLFILIRSDAEAGFVSRFSLTTGEEYNDNIFSRTNKEHDFITFIIPKLTLQYIIPNDLNPTLTFDIAPAGFFYARHPDLNNFGFSEGAQANLGYTYNYSPRLSFHLSDGLGTQGRTRLLASGGAATGLPALPTSFPAPGSTVLPSNLQAVGNSLPLGKIVNNSFGLQGKYLYSPEITITGDYRNRITAFLSQGGSQVINSFGVRGIYLWHQEHHLHAGYNVSIIKQRTGQSNLIHNFNLGDDYLTAQQIRLAPTLTLSLATGVSLNLAGRGPRIANNTTATLTKIWESAQLTAGVRRGLTDSFGIAGVAQTTTVFSNFGIRLSEKLTGSANASYSMFDTSSVDFSAFVGDAGLQYWLTKWLSSSLQYRHIFRDAGAGASSTLLRTSGPVHTNSVTLSLSAYFDIWPNVGFANAMSSLLPVPTTPITAPGALPGSPSLPPTPPVTTPQLSP